MITFRLLIVFCVLNVISLVAFGLAIYWLLHNPASPMPTGYSVFCMNDVCTKL